MDNNISTPTNHSVGTILTLLSVVLGYITWQGIEQIIRIIAGIGSISAAAMGVRYYYYATKKKIT